MDCPSLTDPDLPLDELMDRWPQTVSVFLQHRMLCVGCGISPFHTVTDACREYHLNQDTFIGELLSAADLT